MKQDKAAIEAKLVEEQQNLTGTKEKISNLKKEVGSLEEQMAHVSHSFAEQDIL